VTLFQVLQHVASPVEMLEEARDVLRSEGTLVIETWDRGSAIARLMRSGWHVVAPPSVVWLWDRSSAESLLRSAGLTATSIRRSPKRVSLRFVISLLDGTGRGSRMLERTPLRRLSFLYRLGDLITITAVPRAGPHR
jgi:hypothetical protein